MNIQLIYPKPLRERKINSVEDAQYRAKYDYVGISIEDQGQCYYWAKGISIPITAREQALIRNNPKLFYFSTILKLHHRIRRLREQADGL